MTKTDEASETIRTLMLDQLQAEVRKRWDQFLVGACDWDNEGNRVDYKELNEYAIAEWAYALLERQKAAMAEAVEKELTQ